MNRLTSNDKNLGPFTIGRWTTTIAAYIESGDDEDRDSFLLFIAFGWALRIRVWNWLCRPWQERWVECHWDAETVKRLGRSGYWCEHPRRYGFSLSDMGNGYDFFQLYFGPQTDCSGTTKSWSKHLPWKMWNMVRHSLYTPEGELFYNHQIKADFRIGMEMDDQCPKVHFLFEDYDGEQIVATCMIEEREWHRGTGWFKWLRWFSKPMIRRCLDLKFSAEVGPEKGSWKGGTLGHGIDMLAGESPEAAFRRYCDKTHERKGRKYNLRFIGPCAAPTPRARVVDENCDAGKQCEAT